MKKNLYLFWKVCKMLSLQSLPVQSITAKLVWWKEGTCSSSKVITPSGGISQRQWSEKQMVCCPPTSAFPPSRCGLRPDLGGDVAVLAGDLWRRPRNCGETDGGSGRPRQPSRRAEDRGWDQSALRCQRRGSESLNVSLFQRIDLLDASALVGAEGQSVFWY